MTLITQLQCEGGCYSALCSLRSLRRVAAAASVASRVVGEGEISQCLPSFRVIRAGHSGGDPFCSPPPLGDLVGEGVRGRQMENAFIPFFSPLLSLSIALSLFPLYLS